MARLPECSNYVRIGKEWYLNGKPVPEDAQESLKKMGIPPAWTNVVVNADPMAKIQAVGQDAAGRWQYRYSQFYIDEQKKLKFDRVKHFARDIDGIRSAYEKDIAESMDARAMLLRIEDQTAIRIGSETDFKAKVKAYGLTTLRAEHVDVKGDTVLFDFIAKEGIPAHYEINDPVVAKWIAGRKQITPDGSQIFPDVSAPQLNAYLKKSAGGKNYTVKDFRTFHATRIAYEELMPYAGKYLSEKEKKELVKSVTEKVSAFLANTPVMAKKSYINPQVWDIIGGIE